jgi:fumarylacetoacetate (FAA) hydrolase
LNAGTATNAFAFDAKAVAAPLPRGYQLCDGSAFLHHGRLIAHAAKTRRLRAGTIIGSGTVSNADRSVGSACISERRVIEMLDEGVSRTGFMRFGDTVRMEVFSADGHSIFGAIEQCVVKAGSATDAEL